MTSDDRTAAAPRRVPPPRRPDDASVRQYPGTGAAARALVGAGVGLTAALVVVLAFGCLLGIGAVPLAILACAAFGLSERRKGDPAVAAGILGMAGALAVAAAAGAVWMATR